MAPVDLDNLQAAKQLSAYYLIKHVPINYLTIMIVDSKSLFMFKAPPLSELNNDSFFYLADTFYSNDPKSVERVSEMLNDTWKRGTELSDISSQAGIETPKVEVSTSETLSGLADAMFNNNVSSILITENSKPIGIINERVLLKEMVENRRDPKKTLTGQLAFTPLVSLNGDNSIADILSRMREKGIERATVVKNGQLVGMLTQESAHRAKAKPEKTST